MSEMLDFDFDEDAEADETTDEDLTYLRDACVNINLVVIYFIFNFYIFKKGFNQRFL